MKPDLGPVIVQNNERELSPELEMDKGTNTGTQD